MTKASHWVILILLLALVMGALTFAAHTVFENNTPGIDYYVYWSAGQAFFNRQDPYSPEIDRQIQLGLYGHEAGPDENRMEFANPPYSLFILLPIIWLDFGWSQAAWMAFNILLVFALSYALFPKAPKWIKLTFPLMYPYIFGFILGNFAVTISAFLLIFTRVLIQPNRPSIKIQILLGLLLAWCTIKPQFVWGYMLLGLLYMISKRLWGMLASFISSGIIMALIALIFRPDWILKWIEELFVYQGFNDTLPVLSRYLGRVLPEKAVQPFFYIILVACCALSAYLLVRWWKQETGPVLIIIWMGFFTFMFHPTGGGGVSYAQLIFLIPFFIWASLQKPSLTTAVVWTVGWVFSFICNTTFIIKTPLQSDQSYFLLYIIWMVWVFAKQAIAQTKLDLRPSQSL